MSLERAGEILTRMIFRRKDATEERLRQINNISQHQRSNERRSATETGYSDGFKFCSQICEKTEEFTDSSKTGQKAK